MPTASSTQTDLVDEVVSAFALREEDVEALEQQITAARIASSDAAAREAAKTVAAPLAADWTVPAGVQRQQQQAAHQSARSIAQTYHADLRTQAEGEAQPRDGEDATSLRQRVFRAIADWAKAHLGWKAHQIAQAETGAGADDGTEQLIEDLLAGEVEPGIGMSLEEIEVAVLPDEAAEEFCAAFAGWSFALDQYDDLPDFPVHPNCDHAKVIILA